MKRLLLLVAVLTFLAYVAPLTDEEHEKLKNFAKECISETGVDSEVVEKLNFSSALDELLADNDKLKQYIVCMCKKTDLINAQGLVQKDAVKKGLMSRDVTDKAKADEIADKCAVQKDTLLETAKEMLKCLSKEVKVFIHTH